MPRPKPAETMVQTGLRVREELRARLEAAARRRGVPLNTELTRRLERTLQEERALGGPEMAQLARLMAAAFALASRREAADPDDHHWLTDRDAYRAGVLAVVNALLIGYPDANPGELRTLAEGLKSAALGRAVQLELEQRERAA
jgi:hypothetical protein